MEQKLAAGDREGANKEAIQSKKWSNAAYGAFVCLLFVAVVVGIIFIVKFGITQNDSIPTLPPYPTWFPYPARPVNATKLSLLP